MIQRERADNRPGQSARIDWVSFAFRVGQSLLYHSNLRVL